MPHRADRAKGRDEKAAWQNMIAALNHMRFFSHVTPEKNATVLAKLRDMGLYIVRARIFCTVDNTIYLPLHDGIFLRGKKSAAGFFELISSDEKSASR